MIYMLLPALNEEKGLTAILSGLKEHEEALKPMTVIVVDDGSTDNTARVLAQFTRAQRFPCVHVISHGVNKGLGAAFKTGFSYLCPRLEPHDIVFTMDADNTHPVENVSRMALAISEGYDLVLPSRFVEGSRMQGVNVFRRWLGYGASFYYRALFLRLYPREYTCAYRAYSARLLKRAWAKYGDRFIEEKGFTVTVEILLKLLTLKPNLREWVLILRYDQKESASQMKLFKTMMAHFKLGLKMRFLDLG